MGRWLYKHGNIFTHRTDSQGTELRDTVKNISHSHILVVLLLELPVVLSQRALPVSSWSLMVGPRARNIINSVLMVMNNFIPVVGNVLPSVKSEFLRGSRV